jgi:hypothetical protein
MRLKFVDFKTKVRPNQCKLLALFVVHIGSYVKLSALVESDASVVRNHERVVSLIEFDLLGLC